MLCEINIMIRFVVVFFLLSSSVCAQDSEDFTASVFTGGIEGPAYQNASLYVVNYKEEGTIGVVDSMGVVDQLVKLPNGSIGNSLQFTKDGDLLIADYVNHNVLKYHFDGDSVSIFAHSDLMNQPNDIVRSTNGFVYASDPNWKWATGNLWLIDPNGKVVLLEDSMGTTNGITMSPDEKVLYVNESVQRKVWSYEVDKTGGVKNKKLHYEFADFGMDGMKCSKTGELYIARYGGGVISVVSAEGKLIKEYQLKGEKPTNLVFNKDQSLLFVTMQERKCVEVIRLR